SESRRYTHGLGFLTSLPVTPVVGDGGGGALTDAEDWGGLRAMDEAEKEFSRLVGAVLTRFFAQNGRTAPPDAEMAAFGARLWSIVGERGLPRPLAAHESGAPGGMAEEECAALVARVVGGATDEWLANAAKQLVKACFYPEFKVCRDSWREVAADGGCRRQELKRVRGRVSGTHCVDCPHWVALPAEAHEVMVANEWRAGAADFRRDRGVFLPEDFRALRRWLHAEARRGGGGWCGDA
ncbi:MAG: hypothetical protein HZA93_18760, partial [Verrucomicrobia bacterium]|nr:hypothetical protein [Verrucomicrobiota bacterium]